MADIGVGGRGGKGRDNLPKMDCLRSLEFTDLVEYSHQPQLSAGPGHERLGVSQLSMWWLEMEVLCTPLHIPQFMSARSR